MATPSNAQASSTPTSEAAPKVEEKKEMTPEEAIKLRQEKKAKLAQVLLTGALNGRIGNIMQQVPKDRVPSLIRDKPEDILRFETMGYRVETEATCPIEGIHGDPHGRIKIGDLILVTCSREDYEIREELYEELTRRDIDLPKEEFKQNAENPFDESIRHA